MKITPVILLRQNDEKTSILGKSTFSTMTEKIRQIVIMKLIDHSKKFNSAPYSNFLNSNQAQIHNEHNLKPY